MSSVVIQNNPIAPAHAGTPEPLVRVRGVHKSFRVGDTETPVLRGADFEASPGEVAFLVGPSGCGKTTLLSAIAGTLKVDSGEIELLGTAVHRASSGELARLRRSHLGFVFQQFNLIPQLDAAENVAVPLLLAGLGRAEALRRARASLESVGLLAYAATRASRLSGGQQQRVAIARALVHEPAVVLCDEPTSALDRESGRQILALLREVARRPDRALVVVTHDTRAYYCADRVACMEDGRIERVLGTREEIDALARATP